MRQGIPREAVELQSLEVTDVLAQPYRSGPVESRFILAQTMVACSKDVDVIATAGQRVNELVDAGVVLSTEYGAGGPVYLFTSLNNVKPEMIAEATASARAAAQQFAADSGSSLGGSAGPTKAFFRSSGETTSRTFRNTSRWTRPSAWSRPSTTIWLSRPGAWQSRGLRSWARERRPGGTSGPRP